MVQKRVPPQRQRPAARAHRRRLCKNIAEIFYRTILNPAGHPPESMMRKAPYITSCFILLIACFVSFSQTVTVKAAIDRNKILIGEPITLRLEATVPTGVDASWFPLDSLTHFEVINKSKIDTLNTAGGKTY